MVLYNCIICNFSTTKTTNYNRHLKTKKHIKNVENRNNNKKENNTHNGENVLKMFSNHNSSENTQKKPRLQQNATKCNTKTENCFFCKYCGKEFGKHQSYYRHMKYYCKDKKNDEYKDMLNGMLQQLIQSKDDLINV